MEMQIFELNRLTSRLTVTDTLENFTIEVKQIVTVKIIIQWSCTFTWENSIFYKIIYKRQKKR